MAPGGVIARVQVEWRTRTPSEMGPTDGQLDGRTH
jgi:hypothetical protein